MPLWAFLGVAAPSRARLSQLQEVLSHHGCKNPGMSTVTFLALVIMLSPARLLPAAFHPKSPVEAHPKWSPATTPSMWFLASPDSVAPDTTSAPRDSVDVP